jgi:hypothetical protein
MGIKDGVGNDSFESGSAIVWHRLDAELVHGACCNS